MLDKAVTILTKKDDPIDAWKQLIKPQDIVGIKSKNPSTLLFSIHLKLSVKSLPLTVYGWGSISNLDGLPVSGVTVPKKAYTIYRSGSLWDRIVIMESYP